MTSPEVPLRFEDSQPSPDEQQILSASDTDNLTASSSSPLHTQCESESLSSTSPFSSVETLSDTSLQEETIHLHEHPTLTMYKIVGDNIDKNVQTREMRHDHQTRSLHYFHSYAVADRVDLSAFSNDVSTPDISVIQLDTLLPSSSDETTIRGNFAILGGMYPPEVCPLLSPLWSGY